MNRRVIRPGGSEWPAKLCELHPHRPIESLHVEGLPLQPGDKAVAIVGARNPTLAGLEVAKEMATKIAQAGFPVVSGLAVGIDAAVHRATLEAGGYTIGVLGCGLGVSYPPKNTNLNKQVRTRGTLITEYPDDMPPHSFNFPERNRIIAALAEVVIVAEGGKKSGALITARHALDANRHVYAVPGSARNPMAEGPNELIRANEADLVTCAEHVFDHLAPELAWEEPVQPMALHREINLDESELAVLGLLDDVPASTGRISGGVGLPPGKVALILSRLEVRGFTTKRPVGYEISSAGARVRRMAVES